METECKYPEIRLSMEELVRESQADIEWVFGTVSMYLLFAMKFITLSTDYWNFFMGIWLLNNHDSSFFYNTVQPFVLV